MLEIEKVNFFQKRVLLRCDFNVPLKEGKILDDFRIRKSLKTIRYLREKGAKILLISHLGRPEKERLTRKRKKEYSLSIIKNSLEYYLGTEIRFFSKINKKLKKELERAKPGQLFLLENIRFFEQEIKNDKNFAKELAKLADIYVFDAFGVAHRKQTTILLLPQYLRTIFGFLMEKEIETLRNLTYHLERPYLIIIGGKKLSKIKILPQLLSKADYLLVGGEIANIILRVKGILIGRAWPEDEQVIKIIKKLNLAHPKIKLPVDTIVSLGQVSPDYLRISAPAKVWKDEKIYDIGPETINLFKKIIEEAKTIVWAGPLGMVEKESFQKGSLEIARALLRNFQAFKVVGGGETIYFLEKKKLLDKFSFVSTGGGALLSFLAGKPLSIFEALKKNL